MNRDGFDQEWRLEQLLEANTLKRLAPALGDLLGADGGLLAADGTALWGMPAPDARREALIVELEPIGFIASASATPEALRACRGLLTALLRTELRFKMASTLHLEAVAEDFETLKREHARLLESEARYRKLAEELESRVKAQVAQLEERQQMLYQAEKLASVGQLAAGMAHEINNPLGFVRSNLSTFASYIDAFAALKPRLAEGTAAWQGLDLDFIVADSRDLLADSTAGLERIARIVGDLKSFSNVDRASEEFADVNDCLRDVARVMERQLPAGIALSTELQALPKLVCLPGHLKQLFFNVIRNAIQAIEDSGHAGEIRIDSRPVDHGIEIRIADNGVGIGVEQHDRAFEPFYTTRPVGSGAGLGLSTARNIVLAHSGRIDLAGKPGAGTTVTIFLPTPP